MKNDRAWRNLLKNENSVLPLWSSVSLWWITFGKTSPQRHSSTEDAQRKTIPDRLRSGHIRNFHKAETPLKPMKQLSTSMTLPQFDHGYWYATELKEFAQAIGIPSAGKLRKDELEKAIKLFLHTGKVEIPTRRDLSTPGVKDVERGLRVGRPTVGRWCSTRPKTRSVTYGSRTWLVVSRNV
jgi:hypothetical protein